MLCMGVLSIGSAQIEQDSIKVEQLDEVVVSDSRFTLKRENSGKVITKIIHSRNYWQNSWCRG